MNFFYLVYPIIGDFVSGFLAEKGLDSDLLCYLKAMLITEPYITQ
jgi:hypothetical protein